MRSRFKSNLMVAAFAVFHSAKDGLLHDERPSFAACFAVFCKMCDNVLTVR